MCWQSVLHPLSHPFWFSEDGLGSNNGWFCLGLAVCWVLEGLTGAFKGGGTGLRDRDLFFCSCKPSPLANCPQWVANCRRLRAKCYWSVASLVRETAERLWFGDCLPGTAPPPPFFVPTSPGGGGGGGQNRPGTTEKKASRNHSILGLHLILAATRRRDV